MKTIAPSPARPQESLLLPHISELAAARVLCNTVGRGQFAAEYARQHPQAHVHCWFLDLYQQRQATVFAAQAGPQLHLECVADPPQQEVDLCVWSIGGRGEAELSRELLQTGYQRLAIGGTLLAATDNSADKWLHEQMQTLFTKVTCRREEQGAVYQGVKREPQRKVKNYACEFPFRDRDRLIQLRTRPGVFSHRSLDGGARTLINAMRIAPGMQVLDLGCGSGAVAIAAALAESQAAVVAIDSNPRAIEAVQWAAQHNNAANITAQLDCDGQTIPANSFDLVLANPPYYSNFRLADLFCRTAHRALRPGGKLVLVTKTSKWYEENLPSLYRDIAATPAKSYSVITAIR